MKKQLFIFRIKNWQLFIVLILPLVASIIIESLNLNSGGFDSIKLIAFVRLIGTTLFFSWLLILGLGLNKLKNNPYQFNNTLFILSILFCMYTYIDMNLTVIFDDSYYLPIPLDLEVLFKGIMALFSLFGLIYVFHEIPKSLKSYESKTIVSYSKCLLDLLLILTSAIGIGLWFLQPRLNKIGKLN